LFDVILIIATGFIAYALSASIFKTEAMISEQGTLLSHVSRNLQNLTFIASAPVKEAATETGSDNADVPDL
jgi:hypothetical protein